MYLNIYKFSVSLIWITSLMTMRARATGPACDAFVDESNTFTVNCSRREFTVVPSQWPDKIAQINDDDHVILTFFNNSITNLTTLPAVPGGRIAISFKSNKLIEIEDGTFKNLDHTVYLDLSNNMITGQVLRSEIFQGPYRDGVYGDIALETLNLGNNKIHSLDRYLFKHTPNISRLYLNNNPIEILDHVTVLALSTAVTLQILDLSYIGIDSIPMDAFRSLTKLQQIDLSGNKFTMVPESLGLVGSTLEYLTFNNNPIVELNDDSFLGLFNLKELEISENDYLEEVKRSTFSPLTSLRVLHLCHNTNLRYISHNAFRALKQDWTLKEVYLNDNDLSELPTDLMPWSKLDSLGFSGNPWLCNCDLVNIVTKQGAGKKFKPEEIPTCVAPIKWAGATLQSVTLDYCPNFDTTFVPKKSFSLRNLKPKHILWSIFGVAMVVLLGMVIGLLFNALKTFIRKQRNQPIRYANIHEDSSYA